MRYLRQFFLVVMTLSIFSVLMALGIWQLHRANSKKLLHAQWVQRSQTMLSLTHLDNKSPSDLSYYQIHLTGFFDNAHNLLLDNKIVNHQVGYYIITPFQAFGLHQIILVNRGWIPRALEPGKLPLIPPLLGQQTISGTIMPINTKGYQIGAEPFSGKWPWVVQKVPLDDLSKQLKKNIYSWQINLSDAILAKENLNHDKHLAYAIQWFALAGVFLLGCIILYWQRRPRV